VCEHTYGDFNFFAKCDVEGIVSEGGSNAQ
jgi:hypothetical protein